MAAGRRLQDDGVVSAALGRAVPVVVHELEHDHSDLAGTLAADPPGLADGFGAWIGSTYYSGGRTDSCQGAV